ncbi:MAG: MarR family winged helix-turn-helix transcriptional regulator [Thermomicrobiales bacterium]
MTEHSRRALELSRILVVQAVEAGTADPGEEMTIGVVARRLDIDPSTASRLVSETIRAGYLTGDPSSTDARRIRLTLTDAGRALAAAARRYQRATFEHITRDWSEGERQEFARLFIKFADSLAESRADQIVSASRVQD